MSDLFDLLQDLLLSTDPSYSDAVIKLNKLQKSLDGVELARSKSLERLILALSGLVDDKTGTSDIAALIRQIVRHYHRGLIITKQLWNEISSRQYDFGLHTGKKYPGGEVEIIAEPWIPEWLKGSSQIDQLSLRRLDYPAIGDGLLYGMSQWPKYQSEAQKTAVHASMQLEPGSTLLITLPTGAGKSLCLLLPAWQDSQGGKIKGGTTLVIVPTVSLAIDQEEQVRRRLFFDQAIDTPFSPISLTSATDLTLLPIIRDGIRNGTLPIVFTSPEKIINSEFYDICLEAARNGFLNRLVFDEAHLIETWGASFRTEFQFMSTYRRKLLEASGGQIRTILLSATISEPTEKVLQKLFSEDNNFSLVRANRLRPEISYWFDHSPTDLIRREHVIDAIRHLPRPLILYVTRPDDADEWVKTLNKEGFKRVEAFSGKTDNDERRRIIREWNSNLRDIMVANSAFGMGVDKGDVRTVIHATLPENMDRFYQEVGRSGRDGCSSISLVCSANGDEGLALGMTATARISTEKAVDRWLRMQESADFEEFHGDVLWVDPNVRPRYIYDAVESLANQEWNEHTLLLMQRADLLRIEATRGEEIEDQSSELNKRQPRLKVKLLRPSVTNDKFKLAQAIDHTRRIELSEIRGSLSHLQKLVKNYADDRTHHCIAKEFASLYPDSAMACGGCPDCRRINRGAYSNAVILYSDISFVTHPQAKYLSATMRERYSPECPINIFWDASPNWSNVKQDLLMLSDLVREGCQQFILPDELLNDGNWVREIFQNVTGHPEIFPHMIFSTEAVINDPDLQLYLIPTVVVYPLIMDKADQLHNSLNLKIKSLIYRINIVHKSLMLTSLGGSFYDKVNGLPDTLESFSKSLKSHQDLSFF